MTSRQTTQAAELRLDELDLKILAELQRDAGRSNAEIAAEVGLSPSPCWRRIQRLERAGFVQRRVALLDPEKLGLDVTVLASVKLSAHGRQAIPEFEEAIRGHPEVIECYTVTGQVDFVLRIVTRDTHTYERFLRDQLLQLPHIQEVHSTIVLTQVKYTTEIPLSLAVV